MHAFFRCYQLQLMQIAVFCQHLITYNTFYWWSSVARFLYVGMTGAKEIRIYLIKDDNELLFNTVSFFKFFTDLVNTVYACCNVETL